MVDRPAPIWRRIRAALLHVPMRLTWTDAEQFAAVAGSYRFAVALRRGRA